MSLRDLRSETKDASNGKVVSFSLEERRHEMIVYNDQKAHLIN